MEFKGFFIKFTRLWSETNSVQSWWDFGFSWRRVSTRLWSGTLRRVVWRFGGVCCVHHGLRLDVISKLFPPVIYKFLPVPYTQICICVCATNKTGQLTGHCKAASDIWAQFREVDSCSMTVWYMTSYAADITETKSELQLTILLFYFCSGIPSLGHFPLSKLLALIQTLPHHVPLFSELFASSEHESHTIA